MWILIQFLIEGRACKKKASSGNWHLNNMIKILLQFQTRNIQLKERKNTARLARMQEKNCIFNQPTQYQIILWLTWKLWTLKAFKKNIRRKFLKRITRPNRTWLYLHKRSQTKNVIIARCNREHKIIMQEGIYLNENNKHFVGVTYHTLWWTEDQVVKMIH